MAHNTHVFVGPVPGGGGYGNPTRLTAQSCAPGSTQYLQGSIYFSNSTTQASTVASGQWAQGDVIVCGLSYDSGPAPIYFSFPGQPKVHVSPNPNVVYWISPEYTSLWHLSWYFANWASHQIDVPLGFPEGTVTITRWGGVIDANKPLLVENVRWQGSETKSFNVLSSAKRLPEFTLSNTKWIPNPGFIGVNSLIASDYHSNIPAEYMPYVFTGPLVSDVNLAQDPPYRSIRHPENAVWWNTGGGGSCCNCWGYPMPPPNGCNGENTWTDWSAMKTHGLIPSGYGQWYFCTFCMNLPGGL